MTRTRTSTESPRPLPDDATRPDPAGVSLWFRRLALRGLRRTYPFGVTAGALGLTACGGFVTLLRRWLKDELDLGNRGALVATLGGVWIDRPPSQAQGDWGPPLPRSDAPVLFREIEDLARRLGVRPPSVVHLAYLPCCGIVVGHGTLRAPVLLLGLPLLGVLNRGELRAAVAHELAHLARGDAHQTLLDIRFVDSLAQGVDQLPEAEGLVERLNPLGGWARLCLRTGRRLLGPVARGQERRADRVAAQLAGGENAASALVKTALVQPLFREVLSDFDPEARPGTTLYAHFLRVWDCLPESFRTALRHRLMVEHGRAHDPAHPDLIERLATVQAIRTRSVAGDEQSALTVLCDPESLEQRLHEQLFGTKALGPSVFHRAGS